MGNPALDGAEIPRFISVDDHVVEPPDLWQRYMPSKFKDRAPKLTSRRGTVGGIAEKNIVFEDDETSPWYSMWSYFDLQWPLTQGMVAVGTPVEELVAYRPLHYDNIPAGCYDRSARLVAMDENHTEASLCFPTFPRFCGQVFLERGDRETSLAAVRAYNDWMINEWCAEEAKGRLIPLTIVPLWDPELAAAEVGRCAAMGSHAIAFSESPPALGLPSIHSGAWDVLWRACEDTETVVNMHIGSSSRLAKVGVDTPRLGNLALTFQGSMHGLIDWLVSGVLERFATLKIAFSEGQVGWIPFVLERLDNLWMESPRYCEVEGKLTKPPSHYMAGRVYGCIFDDLAGLANRDAIGMSQIMFETDYPHGDSTWPHSRDVAANIVKKANLNERETYQLVRGNAIDCYGLSRVGIYT